MAAARITVGSWRSAWNRGKLNINTNEITLRTCARCLRVSAFNLATDKPASGLGHGGAKKAEKISMAMKAYLERAQAHETFMKQEIAEYEVGKRHLANIMGADPDSFTQEDIDNAIQYLLPSGLHDKKARPTMRHPLDVIPQKKAAQFGVDGRPYESMFYTGFPNYYRTMHDLAMTYENLKKIEDETARKGMKPLMKLNLGGSRWIEKTVLESKFSETLPDSLYDDFVYMLERLVDHPWAHRFEELIMSFRKILPRESRQDIPQALISESGRPYQTAEGQRKNARAEVTVWDNGTGDVSINGKDLLTCFPCILDREQVMFPLQFTKKLGEVDFEATVECGGHSGQAGALRLALSYALASLVDKNTVENMRLAGLLTRDPRVRERKKYGQEGARKKFTWKKR